MITQHRRLRDEISGAVWPRDADFNPEFVLMRREFFRECDFLLSGVIEDVLASLAQKSLVLALKRAAKGGAYKATLQRLALDGDFK